jgi:hypothetical protein
VSLRDELQDVSRESVEQAVASMAGSKWTMKPRARKALNVLSLGIFPLVGAIRKIVANRQAVKAGKKKPYEPSEIAGDFLDIVNEAGDTVRERRRK